MLFFARSKAVELGLIVELHIGPNYGKQVAEVLRDIPDSVVLIDHFAEPHMGDSVEYADILELASFPNVYMKLSGLSHFAADKPLFESARPFTKRVIEAFGPDRMVWGSGTPVRDDSTRNSLVEHFCFTHTGCLTDRASRTNQYLILMADAVRG